MLKLLNTTNDKGIFGIPVVASYFSKDEIKEAFFLRNYKSSKNGQEDKHSHAEVILLKKINRERELSLLVSIIPCEECLKEMLKYSNIKNIYYIGEYKYRAKMKKYKKEKLNKNNQIKIKQFKPQNNEEYELAKEIYYHFISYSISKENYMNKFVKNKLEILSKSNGEVFEIIVKIEPSLSSYSYCEIIKKISKKVININEENREFIINLIELKKWWIETIKPIRNNNKKLLEFLMQFDFGIKKLSIKTR